MSVNGKRTDLKNPVEKKKSSAEKPVLWKERSVLAVDGLQDKRAKTGVREAQRTSVKTNVWFKETW
jgi:hypothetical protein